MDCCALSWFDEDCYLTNNNNNNNNREGPSNIRVSWGPKWGYIHFVETF